MLTIANAANPCRGQIDPDDSDGKKMMLKIAKGPDDENKFDLTSKNISEFRDQVEEAAKTIFLDLCSLTSRFYKMKMEKSLIQIILSQNKKLCLEKIFLYFLDKCVVTLMAIA